jgi:hypothetical protein
MIGMNDAELPTRLMSMRIPRMPRLPIHPNARRSGLLPGIERLAASALAALLLLILGSNCTTLRRQADLASREQNLSFTIDRNQLVFDGVEVEGLRGRFIVGSATPKTILDSGFVRKHGLASAGTFRVTLRQTGVTEVDENILDLAGEIDAIIGSDVLGPVLVVDYRTRLATRIRQFRPEGDGVSHSWQDRPRFPLVIRGRRVEGIVDTTIPDTVVVPRELFPQWSPGRHRADIEIAGMRLENIDIRVAEVSEVLIGNRILQHFLVTIDYERGRTVLVEW